MNFLKFKEVMLSKDPEHLKELQPFFDQKYQVFLDKSVNLEELGEKVSYTTYPRTGNTFLRILLQKITGIQTGADMPTKIVLAQYFMGLQGEGHQDDSIWVYKSHYPL